MVVWHQKQERGLLLLHCNKKGRQEDKLMVTWQDDGKKREGQQLMVCLARKEERGPVIICWQVLKNKEEKGQ